MSVSPERFDLRTIAPQPWKNGAGTTREIASGGESSAEFDWRVSLAEVSRNAPFSAFPGIDRCIVLLNGGGMQLHSQDGAIDHALTTPLAPFRFSGDIAVDARLVDGPSNDFNVMTRRGAFRSEVSCEREAATLSGGDSTLLFCCAGVWSIATDRAMTLGPLQALLWRGLIGALRVEPCGDAAALIVVRVCHDHYP